MTISGVMLPPQEQLTKEGYDLTFGTNVIGHFLLAKLLMPKLLAGKETSPDKYARIITTSSAMAYFTTLDWDSFKDGPARGKMGMNTLYAQSKFANAVVARELARRYGHQGILSISVNPGNLKTEMQRNIGWFQQTFLNTMLWPAHYGALTQLWAGTMPEAINYNGEFMIPWARPGKCRAEVYDPGVGEKLWNWLEEAVKPFTK
ncbi:hypothetical protein QCA50_014332 [Cerrena zonata]|uniref:NAD(P)-binding protein n=1 Tax=Cerrena zonata TaxID=2478898 RepID=A0AAW0FTB1_9APHY